MSKFCDSMGKRMDALEKERDDAARKDGAKKDMTEAERLAADKAKKDAEEKEKEEKEKADKAKKDAAERERDDRAKADANEAMAKQIKDLEAKFASVPMSVTDPAYGKRAETQARADAVIKLFDISKGAPEPMHGETDGAYRRRLARMLQPHCPKWKGADLTSVAFADDALFGPIEADIYADATAVGNNPGNGMPEGELRVRERRTPTGHIIRESYGNPNVWMDKFAGPSRLIHHGPIRLQKHN
jgi:hypothetical protein